MLVEFTGCTGTGKSTIAAQVIRRLAASDVDAISSVDLVLKHFGLQQIRDNVARSVLLHFLALPSFCSSLRRNLDFYRFASEIILRDADTYLITINLFRNVIKKIAIHEFIRTHSTNSQVVFVDEGTVQAAHNLFVHLLSPPRLDKIATFADLIPMPDVVVYVKAEMTTVCERTVQRGHGRIPYNTRTHAETFIMHATATFDRLAPLLAVKSRLLTVENSGSDLRQAAQLAEHVAEFILRSMTPTSAYTRLRPVHSPSASAT